MPENLLSIKVNSSTFFGLPNDCNAVNAERMLLPVYNTSSTKITILSSTIKSMDVLFALKILFSLPKSSLKKVTSKNQY